MSIFNLDKSPVKDASAPPQNGAKRFFYILITHFWKLVTVSLLFTAFSIPVFTLPAAICARNRVLIKLVRDGECFVWQEFWQEFRADILAALPPALLFLLMLALGYYGLSMFVSYPGSLLCMVLGVLGAMLTVCEAALSSCVFVMRAAVALPMRAVMKNAWRLMLLGGKYSLGIVGVKAIAYILAALFFPISTVLLACAFFGISGLIICALVNVPMDKYVIEQK